MYYRDIRKPGSVPLTWHRSENLPRKPSEALGGPCAEDCGPTNDQFFTSMCFCVWGAAVSYLGPVYRYSKTKHDGITSSRGGPCCWKLPHAARAPSSVAEATQPMTACEKVLSTLQGPSFCWGCSFMVPGRVIRLIWVLIWNYKA